MIKCTTIRKIPLVECYIRIYKLLIGELGQELLNRVWFNEAISSNLLFSQERNPSHVVSLEARVQSLLSQSNNEEKQNGMNVRSDWWERALWRTSGLLGLQLDFPLIPIWHSIILHRKVYNHFRGSVERNNSMQVMSTRSGVQNSKLVSHPSLYMIDISYSNAYHWWFVNLTSNQWPPNRQYHPTV